MSRSATRRRRGTTRSVSRLGKTAYLEHSEVLEHAILYSLFTMSMAAQPRRRADGSVKRTQKGKTNKIQEGT
jgi:hypothetical protein